jgi:hypothetical protein
MLSVRDELASNAKSDPKPAGVNTAVCRIAAGAAVDRVDEFARDVEDRHAIASTAGDVEQSFVKDHAVRIEPIVEADPFRHLAHAARRPWEAH